VEKIDFEISIDLYVLSNLNAIKWFSEYSLFTIGWCPVSMNFLAPKIEALQTCPQK
jgi:hypothetical protein